MVTKEEGSTAHLSRTHRAVENIRFRTLERSMYSAKNDNHRTASGCTDLPRACRWSPMSKKEGEISRSKLGDP